MKALLLLILLTIFVPLQSKAASLSLQAISQLKELTKEIQQSCPPRECIYVGVGRSPTGVLATLELDDANEVVHLPFGISSHKNFAFQKTPPEQIQKRLDKHFETFLKGTSPDKKIVLIDYTLSGDGLNSAEREVTKWEQKYGHGRKIKTIAIDNYNDGVSGNRTTIGLFEKYPDLVPLFSQRFFSGFSKYESFPAFVMTESELGREYIPPKKRSEYITLATNPYLRETPVAKCIMKITNLFL